MGREVIRVVASRSDDIRVISMVRWPFESVCNVCVNLITRFLILSLCQPQTMLLPGEDFWEMVKKI